MTINALNTVSLDGENSNKGASGVFSSVDANLYTNKPPAIGNGGDIKITTNSLSATNGGGLFATSAGNGAAGNIEVGANSINLNKGTLSSDTVGAEGNITLNAKDLLLLRHGSQITTNARGENVIGGNININAKNGFIVAVPKENSDITANSVNYRGGNVRINTQGLFGIQFRDVPSPTTSDITATGASQELSGTVQITTPDVDPTSGLVQLPTNVVDASQQISNACTPGSRQFQNTFVATGRGGLPISPTEPLQDSSTLSAWVRFRAKPENSTTAKIEQQPTPVSTTPKVAAAPTQIVEATGWVFDGNGNVELVAQAPQINPHSRWQTPASCPVSH